MVNVVSNLKGNLKKADFMAGKKCISNISLGTPSLFQGIIDFKINT